ncbi:MAG: LysR substrate-binding domain-containing protein [Bdellovibrionales bacterium]
MNLRDLEYIVAIAELGSLRRAAESCHVSPSTLSIQLGKLEASLGVTLFERSRKRVAPTSAGHEIIALARDIVRQSRRLMEVAREGRDPMGGVLRLGAFPTLAPYYLPVAVPAISRAFPKLTLRLVEDKTARLEEKLRRHELDAALLALPILAEDFVAAPLFDDPFFLACPDKHPFARRASIRMGDLDGETLMLLEDGHCLRDQALAVCHRNRAAEDQEFRATSLETLRQMVASGAGITLMPGLALLPTAGLAYVPFAKKDNPHRTIGLVWRRSGARQKLMDALVEALRTCNRGLARRGTM